MKGSAVRIRSAASVCRSVLRSAILRACQPLAARGDLPRGAPLAGARSGVLRRPGRVPVSHRPANLVVLPTVVVEIVLGIPLPLGPAGLRVGPTAGTTSGSSRNFGLARCCSSSRGSRCLAEHVPRRAIARGTFGWGRSRWRSRGIAVGSILQGQGSRRGGVARSASRSATTALGTLVPILERFRRRPTRRSAPRAGDRRGRRVLADPAISILLTGASARATEAALLARLRRDRVRRVAALALRVRRPAIVRTLEHTLHSTGQFASASRSRSCCAVVCLTSDVGLDFVLGVFAAGICRRAGHSTTPERSRCGCDSRASASAS